MSRAYKPSIVFEARDFHDFADAATYGEEYTKHGKAKLANALVKFISQGFPAHQFTKALYRRLSNMFGHIAHYNQHGFWDVWFRDLNAQRQFLLNILQETCAGSPQYTFCDVERAIQVWLTHSGLVEDLLKRFDAEVKARELEILTRLQAKYPEAVPA